MSYATEFPLFPAADIPAIPAGWQDHSWRNDACPRFHIGPLAIFTDYADASLRDCEGSPRFSVQHIEACEELFASDDWNAVLAFVAAQ
jgi:hypothetical protein